jgi:hypothetical protein
VANLPRPSSGGPGGMDAGGPDADSRSRWMCDEIERVGTSAIL